MQGLQSKAILHINIFGVGSDISFMPAVPVSYPRQGGPGSHQQHCSSVLCEQARRCQVQQPLAEQSSYGTGVLILHFRPWMISQHEHSVLGVSHRGFPAMDYLWPSRTGSALFLQQSRSRPRVNIGHSPVSVGQRPALCVPSIASASHGHYQIQIR